jgi:GntR family transcriptional regulator
MKNAPQSEPAATSPDALQLLAGTSVDRSAGPLYRQIAGILRAPIEDGRLPPGQMLPREADLADFFGVSLITVRQALRDLATEGRVRKQSAKPAVVTAPPPTTSTSFSFNSLKAIIASTAGRHIEILNYRKRRSARAQEVFGLGPTEQAWCLEAVMHSETQPVSQNVIFFPPDIGSRLKRTDFDDVVIFRAVQRHLGIELRGAHVSVRAELADAKLAALLSYREGAPVMAMEMIYYNINGEPVELTLNRNRADAFSLEFDAPNESM